MRQPYLVVGALMVCLLSGGRAVMAQADPGRIPGSVVGAQVLSDRDQQIVITYIDFSVKELQSGEPVRISAARSRLVEPYNQGGTEAFVKFYDQSLANRIAGGMSAKDVAGRMNTLIVAKVVRNEKIVDVIKLGLKDEASAVSYQAAAAAYEIALNKDVPAAVKFGLRAPVMESLKKETSPFVLPYLYVALVEIGDTMHWEAVIAKMNDRLSVHVARQDSNIEVEFEGLRALYVKIVQARANDGAKVTAKLLQAFTAVNVRYMELATKRIAAGDQTLTAMRELCDNGARYAAEQLVKDGTKLVRPVPGTIKGQTELQIALAISDWKEILKGAPISMTDDQINLPTPKATGP